MSDNKDNIQILCQQYLLEADGDSVLAYSLMQLEYSLINKRMPVLDYDHFKFYLEK
ncbi:hypothetical protein QTG56_22955 (plasmid) [Rossellomorea sp. AcN35-11]|nr:hypothetical protein [Rossellomorea aquimaris]WJV32228.1 hypothetical protein QTG56_22955 [Rossellomorea sp. AcN35-11]